MIGGMYKSSIDYVSQKSQGLQEFEEETQAALMIQARFRGKQARSHIKKLGEQKRDAGGGGGRAVAPTKTTRLRKMFSADDGGGGGSGAESSSQARGAPSKSKFASSPTGAKVASASPSPAPSDPDSDDVLVQASRALEGEGSVAGVAVDIDAISAGAGASEAALAVGTSHPSGSPASPRGGRSKERPPGDDDAAAGGQRPRDGAGAEAQDYRVGGAGGGGGADPSPQPSVEQRSAALGARSQTLPGKKVKLATLRSNVGAAQVKEMKAAMKARPTRFPQPVQALRIQLYMLFEEPSSSKGAQALSIFILTCIVFSIVLFIAETMPELKPHIPEEAWYGMELFCTVIFTAEYVIRLAVCTVSGRTVCGFIRTPMNIVDIAAVLPFYVWVALSEFSAVRALGVLRTVRLVRLFRVFKLGRYSAGLQLMLTALRNSSQAALVLSFFLVIGILLFSSAVYYAEKIGCPDQEDLAAATATDGSNRTRLQQYVQECFDSAALSSSFGICCDSLGAPMGFPTIIEGFWWSIVTMTTVGFGDMAPQTTMGRVVGGITMLSGILLIALPIAIIGRKFQEAYDDYVAGQPHLHKPKSEVRKQAELKSAMYVEMGRRLRRIPFVDPEMDRLARDIAEGFDEMSEVAQEQWSMRKCERETQQEALRRFEHVVDRLLTFDDKNPFNAALNGNLRQQMRGKDSAATAVGGGKSVGGQTPTTGRSQQDLGGDMGPRGADSGLGSTTSSTGAARARPDVSIIEVHPPGAVLS